MKRLRIEAEFAVNDNELTIASVESKLRELGNPYNLKVSFDDYDIPYFYNGNSPVYQMYPIPRPSNEIMTMINEQAKTEVNAKIANTVEELKKLENKLKNVDTSVNPEDDFDYEDSNIRYIISKVHKDKDEFLTSEGFKTFDNLDDLIENTIKFKTINEAIKKLKWVFLTLPICIDVSKPKIKVESENYVIRKYFVDTNLIDVYARVCKGVY